MFPDDPTSDLDPGPRARRSPLTLLLSFGLGVCVPFLLSSWRGVQDPSEGVSRSRRTPVVEVAERASPAVVAIEVVRRVERGWRGLRARGEGSGVLINDRGFVLTNYHVVQSSRTARVLLQGGASYDASLVATSEESDLALLRITADADTRFPYAMFGASGTLVPGETVVALGNPYGLQHTVSTGVVSAVKRTVRLPGSEEYNDFIQTDAAINPGNSGGALLNLDGELVGISTAIFNQGWGIAFAIPVDRIKEILENYVYKEHYLGLETEQVAGRLQVASVHPGSRAARAGVEAGDILRRLDGHPLRSRVDLVVASLGASREEPLHLELSRDGDLEHLTFSAISLLWDRLGVRGTPGELTLPDGSIRRGLLVDQLRDPSPASTIDVGIGDLLFRTTIDGDRYPVAEEADLARLLERFSGEAWKIEILRGGRVFEGTVTPRP